MLVEINNTTRNKIDKKLVKRVTELFLKQNKLLKKEVSIAFVGDRKIKSLNRLYRKKDQVTDVLAFEGEDDPWSSTGTSFLGEIIICYEQIKRQAERFSGSIDKELVFILVHGLLHLLGYQDKTELDKRKMKRAGEKFIKTIKL